MWLKGKRLSPLVVVAALCAAVCCLTSLPPLSVRHADGAMPSFTPLLTSGKTCDRVSHTMKKFGRHRVMTIAIRDSLFQELGEPDLPVEDDDGYKYCWHCYRSCPDGQERDGDTSCIYMNFDWRVTGYGAPGCKRKLTEAESMRKKAEDGDANAQDKLGDAYYFGRGVSKDYEEAIKWYQKAAEQGNRYAQNSLGDMYRQGIPTSVNYEAAVKWYRKSAEQGYDKGQGNLAFMYSRGYGVTKDDKQAAEWFRKSAEHGNAIAQANLALLYKEGRGVPKDYNEALKWYRKAAAQGNTKAQEALSKMGIPVENKKETRKPDGGSRPTTPDQARDRKRPAKTSGDVCESAQMLLDRLADGIAEDDKDGRIDMGNMKEVTDGQAISLKWQDDMRKVAKVLHNVHEIAKIDPLSDATFQIDKAVRLYIKQKKEKERTRSNDCDSLNNTLDKFKREIARIKELCHPIIIPTEMTYPMQQCQPQSRDSGWQRKLDALYKCREDCKKNAPRDSAGIMIDDSFNKCHDACSERYR